MEQVSGFDKKQHIIGAIVGPICALLVWFLPISGLDAAQHKLLAIMSLVAI